MTDYPIKFTIPINPVTKKNSGRIFYRGKTPFIMPSKTYEKYEKAVKDYIDPLMIDEPINVEAKYYRKTRHNVDLNNLHNALHDCLTKYKMIEDDNCTIIASTDGSRVYLDRENPRTEIVITKTQKTFNK